MPKLFNIGRYVIFFWSGENGEPIHVHVSVSKISPSATKIWLTKGGGAIIAHNKSKIPQTDLNKILDVICDNYVRICNDWMDFFETEQVRFYC